MLEGVLAKGLTGYIRAFTRRRRPHEGDASARQNVQIEFPIDLGPSLPEVERSIDVAFDIVSGQTCDHPQMIKGLAVFPF
jgi:hypothetical protein